MKINPMNTVRDQSALPSRYPRRKLLPLLIACLGATAIGNVSANPVDPTVVSGTATFSQQGNLFSITNTPNAVINWGSFSIRAGETVRFVQQSSSSTVLNRVTGQDPSKILGALESNGRVFLINPNGVLFGRNSQVNVAGLVASTLAISNADFLAGKYNFAAGNVAGDVSNRGTITTPSGGQVVLIAPNVTNNGIITSPQGEVVLAAGHSVQLADTSNPGMHVVVSAPADQALNLGKIIAKSGRIGIYGALVNQRGVLDADSAVLGAAGKIILKSSGTTLLEAGSVTTATGSDTGGEIQVLGKKVGLMGDASVDASGQNGGGTVLVGGDYHGDNSAVMNADQTYISKDAKIAADAIVRGNGGKVIVWGNQTTQAYGSISARGGALSGNGGFVETSGGYLDIAGIRVDASAPNGQRGNWLLDPLDIFVTPDSSWPTSADEVAAFATNGNGSSSIFAGTLSASGTNIILQAKHDITFNSTVHPDYPGVGLTAQAGNNIYVNATIATGTGSIVLSANDNGAGTASGNGRVIISSGGSVTADGGTVTIRDFTTTPVPPPPPPPPSADICTIAPNSALCQILSPPTASEPVKPVQQASNEIIKTVTASTPKTDFDQVAFLDTKKTASTNTSSGSSTPPPADDKKADTKSDTKEVASNDKSGTKNEPVKKMYCN
jgi:filamentous hemagglutinin family protein